VLEVLHVHADLVRAPGFEAAFEQRVRAEPFAQAEVRDRIRMAVRDDGKDAVTHFRLRERFRAHTLLECRLETGRTHQIRVHMQHLKHPIVGDPLYGGPLKLPKGATPELIEALRGFRRQALHAEVLEFAHPVTGEAVRCSAPIPDDMRALVRALHDDAVAAKQDNR
jgi:23S rRNA pseudouridine1911/1915/1917 synthase